MLLHFCVSLCFSCCLFMTVSQFSVGYVSSSDAYAYCELFCHRYLSVHLCPLHICILPLWLSMLLKRLCCCVFCYICVSLICEESDTPPSDSYTLNFTHFVLLWSQLVHDVCFTWHQSVQSSHVISLCQCCSMLVINMTSWSDMYVHRVSIKNE